MIDKLYTDIRAFLPPGTPFYLGDEHMLELSSAPRLVMYPARERLRVGETVIDPLTGRPEKAFAMRSVTVDFTAFARDYDAANILAASALLACHKLGFIDDMNGGGIEYGTWEETKNLRYARLSITLRGAFFEKSTWAEIVTIAHECEMQLQVATG